MRFREKLIQFMYGRNGFDKLCMALLWTGIILSFINIFIGSLVVVLLQYAIFIYCLFRVMSRNIYKRRKENQWFISSLSKIRSFFNLQKNKFRDRKTHIYRVCPCCKANLRLPKKKGSHTVKCPKCGERFDVKN